MDTGPFPSFAGQHIALDPAYLTKHLATVAEAASKTTPFDTFVGCGMGSIPWVVLLSITMNKPYVLVRKAHEYSKYTNDRRVVGRFGVLRRCLFVDDCVCSGRTQEHVDYELRKVNAELVGTLVWTNFVPDSPYDHRARVENQHAAETVLNPG